MNKSWIIGSIAMLQLLFMAPCAANELPADDYRQRCVEQVRQINAMPLNLAYIIPIDSAENHMSYELLPPYLIDHCRTVAKITAPRGNVLATIWFDKQGRVRKLIKVWGDGRDLNSICYYDENGALAYAVFNDFDQFGKVYRDNHKAYFHCTGSTIVGDESRGVSVNAVILMSVQSIAERYRIRELKMPVGCDVIVASQFKKGDEVTVCSDILIVANIMSTDSGCKYIYIWMAYADC